MRVSTSDADSADSHSSTAGGVAGQRRASDPTAMPSPSGSALAGSRARRILGVDAARGVALLAMMSVHVYPEYTYPELAYYGDRTFAHVLVAGRAAAAFALLAGVALVLSTARLPRSQA
nr:heparan-alpha-glucosaminide N-acetyltransferase domain-containing protein [Micromonospora sp. DSM 115978]